MRTVIVLALTCLAFLATHSVAQDKVDDADAAPVESDLILEPDEDVKDPELKPDGEYSSQAVGNSKRWQLDSGEFDSESTAPKPQGNSGDGDGYSGFRLRLPTKPD